MSKRTLDNEERAFFERVGAIVYTNPFTVDRKAITARFGATQGPGHHFAAIAPPLDAQLARLAGRGIRRLDDLAGADRQRVRHGFLFHAYHHCVDELDAVIEAQLAAPEEPVAVPFAARVLDELTERGFDDAEASRYFGLFFQLRRAYYFIERALIGPSRSMAELRRALWNSVFTEDAQIYDRHLWNRMEDFSTLLLGETGTGKGAAAAAIGRSAFIPFERARGRFAESFMATFIATNLSQFSESLIESELFGHRKGAFTGAVDNHRGLLERCSSHGALFLDEIGEVSVATQIKLLKVLQERTFSPVGSHEVRRFAGRVIAATNRSPDELHQAGFRDDFYYRLSSQVVTVPPLRQRIAESPDELPQLTALLVARTTASPAPALTGRVLSTLHRDVPHGYPWPGNVRELEQAIRRILLTHQCRPEPREPNAADLVAALDSGSLSAPELLHRYCALLHARLGTYEAVARRTGLDRRTAKKYVTGDV